MKKFTLSLAAFCLFGFTNAQLTTLSVGDVAPDFSVTDLHGDVHTKAEYANKYLIVDLFAYWCGPCAQLAPIVNELYVKYGCNGYNIQVLAVEYEGTTAQTQAFEDANGGDANHPTPTVSGADGGGAAFHASYQVGGFPTFILIGPDGLIKATDIWPISNVASFESALTSAGATLTPHNCATGGIEDSELALIDSKLYPNPSNGAFTFEFESNTSDVLTINVIDIIGQNLYSKEYTSSNGSNALDFNFAELKSGSYFFNVTNSEGVTSSHPFQVK